MAKVIPAKKKLKSKKKPIPGREISDAEVSAAMQAFEKITKDRGRLLRLYYEQDEDTRRMIDRMLSAMRRMAGEPYITIRDGKTARTVAVEQELQDRNFIYIAMRILVRLAEMDIQIANFRLPKEICAECGRDT